MATLQEVLDKQVEILDRFNAVETTTQAALTAVQNLNNDYQSNKSINLSFYGDVATNIALPDGTSAPNLKKIMEALAEIGLDSQKLEGKTLAEVRTLILDAIRDNVSTSLDTLNKIATAINNDPNYHNSVLNSIANAIQNITLEDLLNVVGAPSYTVGSNYVLKRLSNGNFQLQEIALSQSQQAIEDLTNVDGLTNYTVDSIYGLKRLPSGNFQIEEITSPQYTIEDLTNVDGLTNYTVNSNYALKRLSNGNFQLEEIILTQGTNIPDSDRELGINLLGV